MKKFSVNEYVVISNMNIFHSFDTHRELDTFAVITREGLIICQNVFDVQIYKQNTSNFSTVCIIQTEIKTSFRLR